MLWLLTGNGLAADPTASVTVSGIGSPPFVPGKVHTDATWANCTNANKVEVTLYQVTGTKPRAVANLATKNQVTGVGASGSLGNDWDNTDGLASGMRVYAVVIVYDTTNQVIKSGQSLDFIVP